MQLSELDLDYLSRNGKGGIYALSIVGDHRVYIGQSGSSVGIRARIVNHTSALKRGNHRNARLQNAWNKYGEESFEAYVVEVCDDNALDEREIFWIRACYSYASHGGFNICEGGSGEEGNPMKRPEVRAKVTGRKFSDEHRAKIGVAKLGVNNPMKRPEVRAKVGDSLRGRKMSPEFCARLGERVRGEKNPNFGKKLPPEEIQKRTATRRANAERKREAKRRANILANLAVIVPLVA